jgi:GntR family transcriptional regulator/MocR family aminotransferase
MEPLLPISIRLPEPGRRELLQELHRQLRSAIVEGRLRPGLRLPSTRSLATLYGISRNTAVAAYDLLLSEGYVVARHGSGTRVALTLPKPPGMGATGTVGSSRNRSIAPYWRSAHTLADGKIPPPLRWSFRLGVPDAESFPVAIWRRLCRQESRTLHAPQALETDPRGRRELREAIARHVSFTRAVACSPDDILVTAGAQQAFDLLARVLVDPGRTGVALEDPGYGPLRAAFEAAGGQVTGIAVDDDGLIVDQLPRNAGVVCVTPSHQFPLGCVLSARRRAALLDFAQSRNAVIIEDDYDGEFRHADRPLDALQTLDRHESVFYVGTFSKCLLPTLRLGYVVAPPWAYAALLAAKSVAQGSCCGITQGILASLVQEGHLARHVRKMQRVYGHRRQVLIDGVNRDLSRWLAPIPSAAGLHVAATLKVPLSDKTVAEAAFRAGLGVRALGAFATRRAPPRGLVFGFGAIKEPGIIEGLAVLRRVLSSASRGS